MPLFEFRDDPGTGNPGAGVVGTLLTPPKISDNPETYTYVPSAPILLQPGTKYWLFGHLTWPLHWYGSDPSVPPTGIATAGKSKHDVYGGWTEFGSFMPSFQIHATAVPEPASALAASLLCALGGLASRRRALTRIGACGKTPTRSRSMTRTNLES